MPLQKLSFPPGINKESTQYASEGVGWYNSNRIRFRKGLPEKIRGWEKRIPEACTGVARSLHTWRTLYGETVVSIGTDSKLYVIYQDVLVDVTPQRPVGQVLGDDPIAVTEGSKTVTVSATAHGLTSGDTVIIHYSDSVGGVPQDEINGTHTITVVDVDTFTFLSTTAASGTTMYGGGFAATSGGTSLPVDPFSVTAASTTVTVLQAGHGLAASDTSAILEATTFSGIPAVDLNATQTVVEALSPNAWTFTVSTTSDAYTGGGDMVVVEGPLVGATPLSAVSGSPVVTVTHASHAASVREYVTISGATTFAGLTTTSLNTEFAITEILTVDTYTITLDANATSTATGGGDAVHTAYDIIPGSVSDVYLTGWGVCGWGADTWGTKRDCVDDINNVLVFGRIWSMDNWGEDLVACPWGGAVYKWDATNPLSRAVRVHQAPSQSHLIKVTDSRHLTCFACNNAGDTTSTLDTMHIQWCSQENITDWDITQITSSAGDYLLTGGSQILARAKVEGGILIWTDDDLHVMQSVGPPYYFSFNQVGTSTGIVSPNAWVAHNGIIFWMSDAAFYAYKGGVAEVQSTVQDYIFATRSFEHRRKSFAGVDRKNNEVMWFYPSDTVECVATNERVTYGATTVLATATAGFPASTAGGFSVTLDGVDGVAFSYTSKDDTTFYGVTWTGTDPGVDIAQHVTLFSAGDAQSHEPFRYAVLGLDDQTWWVGLLERTAWMDAGDNAYPLAARVDGHIMNHEFGFNAEDAPLVCCIESSEFDIGEGDKFAFVRRVIPDFEIVAGSVDMVFKTRRYPHAPQVKETVGKVYNDTQKISTRLRGRQMSVRITSYGLNDEWRYGATRLDMQEDGGKD